jgi:hypothetical protein
LLFLVHTNLSDYIYLYILVRRGGLLLEAFLEGFSGFTAYRLFKKLATKASNDNVDSIPYPDNTLLLQMVITKFYAWLLFNINSVTVLAYRQQFFHTMALRFYGLSRTGIEVLYRLGIGCSITSMDNLLKVHLAFSKDHNRYILLLTIKLGWV